MASPKRKSKGTAALLVFFLGVFGADLFYVGKTGLGILRLVLFFIGIVIGVPLSFLIIGLFLVIPISIILLVWQVIDFIRYLTMSEERFQQMVAGN